MEGRRQVSFPRDNKTVGKYACAGAAWRKCGGGVSRAGLYLALELLDTFGSEVWVHAPLNADAGTCDETAYRRASNRAGQQLRSGRGEKRGTRA